MLTEKSVLDILDKYSPLIYLDHPYSYTIDSRLNVFCNKKEQWVILTEKLGYNPRGDSIRLELICVGNCLGNVYKKESIKMPINFDNFNDSLDYEVLKPDAKYWLVRSVKVELSHNKQDYIDAEIELKQIEPNEISAEEAERLIILKHRNLFRATDDEFYQLIPKELKKILVIDEWYHIDYEELYEQHISQEKIDMTYELSKHFAGGKNISDYDTFVALYKQKEQRIYDESLVKWQNSLPSSYETWQQIAKVIVTGDTSFYKPTLEPNTHWKFHPESGSL